MDEACWGVSYGNEYGAAAHNEAEEPNKLRNPSCRYACVNFLVESSYIIDNPSTNVYHGSIDDM
jgi:hypothetical protein